MKIKTIYKPYSDVLKLKSPKHKAPKKPNIFLENYY